MTGKKSKAQQKEMTQKWGRETASRVEESENLGGQVKTSVAIPLQTGQGPEDLETHPKKFGHTQSLKLIRTDSELARALPALPSGEFDDFSEVADDSELDISLHDMNSEQKIYNSSGDNEEGLTPHQYSEGPEKSERNLPVIDELHKHQIWELEQQISILQGDLKICRQQIDQIPSTVEHEVAQAVDRQLRQDEKECQKILDKNNLAWENDCRQVREIAYQQIRAAEDKVALANKSLAAELEVTKGKLIDKQQQLDSLIEKRLKGVDRYQPMADNLLMEKFTTLRGKVEKFARKCNKALVPNKNEVELTQNLKSELKDHMLTEISTKAWIREKDSVFESFLWYYLEKYIFSDPLFLLEFGGFSNYSLIRNDIFRIRDEIDFPSLMSSKEYHMWRFLTITHLIGAAGGSKEQEKAREERTLQLTALGRKDLEERIGSRIWSLVDKKKAEALSSELEKIVTAAVLAAVVFMAQRCGLELKIPFEVDRTKKVRFDDSWHESISGAGDVDCVVTPALIKHGDGMGENPEESVVLVKARVLQLAI